MSVENDSSQVESLTTGSGYPTYPVAPGYRVNVRSGPGTNYSVEKVLAYGASVTIRCQTPGEWISGPYGTTNLWDCVGNGLFVADAYVNTGSDGYVAGRCA
ncbi:peptidase [Streptomyces sp. NPDC003042]